jgi:hypothetical protein
MERNGEDSNGDDPNSSSSQFEIFLESLRKPRFT